jgi:hypothetical protein
LISRSLPNKAALPHPSAERLAFPGNRQRYFRGYASNSRHSLQKDLAATYGKASLTALGGGKQHNFPTAERISLKPCFGAVYNLSVGFLNHTDPTTLTPLTQPSQKRSLSHSVKTSGVNPMANSKCKNCGLVNPQSATECKRCGAALAAEADSNVTSTVTGSDAEKDDSGGVWGCIQVLILLAVAGAITGYLGIYIMGWLPSGLYPTILLIALFIPPAIVGIAVGFGVLWFINLFIPGLTSPQKDADKSTQGSGA